MNLAPTDPRHGTVAGRVAKCGCFPCRAAISRWRANRVHHIRQGTWHPWADTEPVRDHLKELSDYGIGWEQVVNLTRLPAATISRILYPAGERPPLRRIRKTTADRILAVEPCLANMAASALVDGTGTTRRLQALTALGWPMSTVGDMLPVHPHTARLQARFGGQCTAQFARAVIVLYGRICMTLPPDTMATRRARSMARQWGWVPPLAWDDEDIDDPAVEPRVDAPEQEYVDDVALGQVERGVRRWAALTELEQRALVRRHIGTASAKTLAQRWGTSRGRVEKLAVEAVGKVAA